MAGEPILIVDDNPANLKLARVLLAGEGYDVRTARDAPEAVPAARLTVLSSAALSFERNRCRHGTRRPAGGPASVLSSSPWLGCSPFSSTFSPWTSAWTFCCSRLRSWRSIRRSPAGWPLSRL